MPLFERMLLPGASDPWRDVCPRKTTKSCVRSVLALMSTLIMHASQEMPRQKRIMASTQQACSRFVAGVSCEFCLGFHAFARSFHRFPAGFLLSLVAGWGRSTPLTFSCTWICTRCGTPCASAEKIGGSFWGLGGTGRMRQPRRIAWCGPTGISPWRKKWA